MVETEEISDVLKVVKEQAAEMLEELEETNERNENAKELLAKHKRWMNEIGKLLQNLGYGN